MKELIVIVGTVILGCLVFNMICGDGHSLKSAGKGVMEKNIAAYEEMNQ